MKVGKPKNFAVLTPPPPPDSWFALISYIFRRINLIIRGKIRYALDPILDRLMLTKSGLSRNEEEAREAHIVKAETRKAHRIGKRTRERNS